MLDYPIFLYCRLIDKLAKVQSDFYNLQNKYERTVKLLNTKNKIINDLGKEKDKFKKLYTDMSVEIDESSVCEILMHVKCLLKIIDSLISNRKKLPKY